MSVYNLGPSVSVFIVAEAGSNHMGDIVLAMRLIDAAADAGADAVKFQMFRADRLYEPGPLREVARQWEMPLFWLPDLAERAERRGLEFMCSAFDKGSIDAVDPYVKRHKIASLEATDTELVAHAVSKGKPLIISTGTMDRTEIARLNLVIGPTYRRVVPTTLLHCVSAYPAPLDQANMRVLGFENEEWYASRCEGLSDHSTDPLILPIMAVALGARVIEKHLRLADTPFDAPDFPHSTTPYEFGAMVGAIRAAESALGDGQKRAMPCEGPMMALRRGPGKLRGEA